ALDQSRSQLQRDQRGKGTQGSAFHPPSLQKTDPAEERLRYHHLRKIRTPFGRPSPPVGLYAQSGRRGASGRKQLFRKGDRISPARGPSLRPLETPGAHRQLRSRPLRFQADSP